MAIVVIIAIVIIAVVVIVVDTVGSVRWRSGLDLGWWVLCL